MLSDASGSNPLRIGVLTTGGSFLVKEGSLGASWTLEGTGVSQGILSGNLLGVVEGGTFYVKQGSLGAAWVNESINTTAGVLWSPN